ncbi:unnamed protein product, partial [Closterium sp. NIES-54]
GLQSAVQGIVKAAAGAAVGAAAAAAGAAGAVAGAAAGAAGAGGVGGAGGGGGAGGAPGAAAGGGGLGPGISPKRGTFGSGRQTGDSVGGRFDWSDDATSWMDDLVIGRDGEEDLEEMKTPELAEADLLVWMGDLNYRVEGVSHEHARHQVAARNLPALLASDQLLREMAGGRAFRGMEEGLIAFPPTYKFDRGTPDPLVFHCAFFDKLTLNSPSPFLPCPTLASLHALPLCPVPCLCAPRTASVPHALPLCPTPRITAYDSGEKRRVPAWCDRVLFRDSFTPSLLPMLPPTLGPTLPPILAPSLPLSLSLPAAPNNPSQPLYPLASPPTPTTGTPNHTSSPNRIPSPNHMSSPNRGPSPTLASDSLIASPSALPPYTAVAAATGTAAAEPCIAAALATTALIEREADDDDEVSPALGRLLRRLKSHDSAAELDGTEGPAGSGTSKDDGSVGSQAPVGASLAPSAAASAPGVPGTGLTASLSVSAPQRATEEQECTLTQPVKAHVLRYDACMEAIQSDHKPVRCLLDVSVASVDLPATRCLLGRLLTLSSQVRAALQNSHHLPDVPAAGTCVDVDPATGQASVIVMNRNESDSMGFIVQCEGETVSWSETKEETKATEGGRDEGAEGRKGMLGGMCGGSGRGDWPRGQMVRAGGGFPLWLKVLPGAGILIAGGSMTINFCVSTSHAAPPGSPATREHTQNTVHTEKRAHTGHTEQHEQHESGSGLLLQPVEQQPIRRGSDGEEAEAGQGQVCGQEPRWQRIAMTARTSRIPAFGDWALDDHDDSQGDESDRRLKYTHEFALLRQKPRGPPSPHSLLLDASSFDSATPSFSPSSATPSAASAGSAASEFSASSFVTASRHSRGSSSDRSSDDNSLPSTTRDVSAGVRDDVERILASTSPLSPVSPAADTCLFPEWTPILPQRRISQGRKGGFLAASSSRSSGKSVSRSSSSSSSGGGGSGKNASKRRELPVLLNSSQLDQLDMPPPPPLLPLSASSSLQASDSGADSTDTLTAGSNANDADDSSSLATHRAAECTSPSRPRYDHGSDSPSYDSPPLPRYSFTFHSPAPGTFCASGASCADPSAPGATSGEASPGEAAERVRQRLRNSRSLRISVSRQLMDSSNSAPSSPVRASGAFGSPFGSPSASDYENGSSATPGRRGSRAQGAAAADRCWDDSSVLALLEHSRLCRQEVVQLLGLCQPGLAPLAPSAQPAPVAPVAEVAEVSAIAPTAPAAPVVSSAGIVKDSSGGERQAEASAGAHTAGGTGEARFKIETACAEGRAEPVNSSSCASACPASMTAPHAYTDSTTAHMTETDAGKNDKSLTESAGGNAGGSVIGSIIPCCPGTGGMGGISRAALRVAAAPRAPCSVAPSQSRGRAFPPTMSSALKYNAGAEDKGFSVMFAEMRERRQQEKAAADATGNAAAAASGFDDDSEENKIQGGTVAAGSCGDTSKVSSSPPRTKAACRSSKSLQWIGVRADDMDFILKELAEAAMGGGEEVAGFDEFAGEETEDDGGGLSESDYVSEETSDCDCSEAERQDNELIAVLRKVQGREWWGGTCAGGGPEEA